MRKEARRLFCESIVELSVRRGGEVHLCVKTMAVRKSAESARPGAQKDADVAAAAGWLEGQSEV